MYRNITYLHNQLNVIPTVQCTYLFTLNKIFYNHTAQTIKDNYRFNRIMQFIWYSQYQECVSWHFIFLKSLTRINVPIRVIYNIGTFKNAQISACAIVVGRRNALCNENKYENRYRLTQTKTIIPTYMEFLVNRSKSKKYHMLPIGMARI